jgi:basic membrane lipoprotein Med (substrate-binding protein (PBP1-ABC) superfamily)
MGADAIMAVAGPQTIDTVQEIKNQGSKCIVVGVDTPQEDNPTVNDSGIYTDNALTVDTSNSYVNHVSNNSIIKFSAIKGIQPIINTIG